MNILWIQARITGVSAANPEDKLVQVKALFEGNLVRMVLREGPRINIRKHTSGCSDGGFSPEVKSSSRITSESDSTGPTKLAFLTVHLHSRSHTRSVKLQPR